MHGSTPVAFTTALVFSFLTLSFMVVPPFFFGEAENANYHHLACGCMRALIISPPNRESAVRSNTAGQHSDSVEISCVFHFSVFTWRQSHNLSESGSKFTPIFVSMKARNFKHGLICVFKHLCGTLHFLKTYMVVY